MLVRFIHPNSIDLQLHHITSNNNIIIIIIIIERIIIILCRNFKSINHL